MRIAFDARPLVKGNKTGVAYCEHGILKAFLENYPGNEYILQYYAKAEDKSLRIYREAQKHCVKLPTSLGRALTSLAPIPYKWLFGGIADITHFFDYIAPYGVSGKTVITVHDMAYRAVPETVRIKTKSLLELRLQKSCQRSDLIMTVSEFSKGEIQKYLNISEDKIFVAPLGVDRERFFPHNNRSEYLLYVGTIEPRKNIERLLKAYATIKDAPQLLLAGGNGWMYDSIYKAYENLKLGNRVKFLGYVADEDIPMLMRGAIAFIFPSLYEGFGLPPLEAMACGTPVVISNTASLPEVVGDCGVYVDPFSIDSIADGIRQILDNRMLRHSLAKRGELHASGFTWHKTSNILLEGYKKCLNGDAGD